MFKASTFGYYFSVPVKLIIPISLISSLFVVVANRKIIEILWCTLQTENIYTIIVIIAQMMISIMRGHVMKLDSKETPSLGSIISANGINVLFLLFLWMEQIAPLPSLTFQVTFMWFIKSIVIVTESPLLSRPCLSFCHFLFCTTCPVWQEYAMVPFLSKRLCSTSILDTSVRPYQI